MGDGTEVVDSGFSQTYTKALTAWLSRPRGGIGIHGRLRACARQGMSVRVGPGAFPLRQGMV